MPIHEETRAHPERLADDDRHTIAALLRGDERAYAELVDRHHGSLLRLAQTYVRTRGIAEEVVQETWLGVLRGLPAFEGRSSLRTWIHRILVNTATTRGVRESRTIPFSSITGDEPLVDSRRFLPADHPAYPGHWAAPPRSC